MSLVDGSASGMLAGGRVTFTLLANLRGTKANEAIDHVLLFLSLRNSFLMTFSGALVRFRNQFLTDLLNFPEIDGSE